MTLTMLSVLALLCVAGGTSAQPVRLPVYGVRHVTDTVRIDGVLNESTWVLASRVGEIRRIDNPSQRPAFPSEATLAWGRGQSVCGVCLH